MIIPFRHKEQNSSLEQIVDPQVEYTDYSSSLLSFIVRHSKTIIVFFLLLLSIVIIAGIWSWYSSREETRAQAELGQILINSVSTEQFDILTKFGKTAPSSLQKGIVLQLAFWAVQLEQYQKAAEEYGVLYNKDPKGAIGILSGLNQADLLQRNGNWKEALNVLLSLEKVASNPILTGIYESQAICAEHIGEKNIAISAYKKLIDELNVTGVDATYYENKLTILSNS